MLTVRVRFPPPPPTASTNDEPAVISRPGRREITAGWPECGALGSQQMSRSDPWPAPMDHVRRLLARHLRGSGVELGPGDHPFPVPASGVERLFVDRWTADQNRKLFDELGDDP